MAAFKFQENLSFEAKISCKKRDSDSKLFEFWSVEILMFVCISLPIIERLISLLEHSELIFWINNLYKYVVWCIINRGKIRRFLKTQAMHILQQDGELQSVELMHYPLSCHPWKNTSSIYMKAGGGSSSFSQNLPSETSYKEQEWWGGAVQAEAKRQTRVVSPAGSKLGCHCVSFYASGNLCECVIMWSWLPWYQIYESLCVTKGFKLIFFHVF